MWDQQPSFRFAIDDNFWEKEAGIASQVFVAGGCEWYNYKKKTLCVFKNDIVVHFRLSRAQSLVISGPALSGCETF
ncbi:hypothetical protein YC2023_063899 [Brassica napus]